MKCCATSILDPAIIGVEFLEVIVGATELTLTHMMRMTFWSVMISLVESRREKPSMPSRRGETLFCSLENNDVIIIFF